MKVGWGMKRDWVLLLLFSATRPEVLDFGCSISNKSTKSQTPRQRLDSGAQNNKPKLIVCSANYKKFFKTFHRSRVIL